MVREFLFRFFPGLAARVEAESRTWMMRCPSCNAEVSVWDAGGLRYKARGRARRLGRCPACRQRGMLDIYKRPSN